MHITTWHGWIIGTVLLIVTENYEIYRKDIVDKCIHDNSLRQCLNWINTKHIISIIIILSDTKACIPVSDGTSCVLVQDFCTRDLLITKIWEKYSGRMMVVVASGFFPYSEMERLPLAEVSRLENSKQG